VSRALPFTFTTALDANPPPFTVSVNAGPPVATIEGEIEVIRTPVPVSGAFCGDPGPSSVALIVDVSFPATEGVNVRVTSQPVKEVKTKGSAVGQGENPSPLETNVTIWKSAGFVPPPVAIPGEETVTVAVVPLNSVEFIGALVVPTATAPKFTGSNNTPDSPAVKGVPVIGIACGLPEPLSIRFSVALLTALPGVVGLAK
jgi:hypothetical protein